jgi:beta-lactamase class A
MRGPVGRWVGIVALFALVMTGRITSADEDAKKVEAELTKAIDVLPGETGFLFTELTDDGPVALYGKNQDKRFAIGSSFKLYIIGRLAKDVNNGRRRLENVMRLRPDLIGPPHSELATWPIGSPVTLQTLALKMISISDNTATDHLLYLLGRERVEAMMAEMGHGDPSVNRPLLSTRDMAELRDRSHPDRMERWKRLDTAGRRKLLAEEMSGIPDYEGLDFDASAFDVAEWYASPMDMARALDWIRRHTTEDDPAHPLRGVIAVTTQIEFDHKLWPYVGFKGGSEDRLIAGNWLMRRRDGKWFTFHFACNSKDKDIDQSLVVGALQKMLEIIDAKMGSGQ